MLSTLSIHNVVLIEELTIELHPGFNVVTGETGAGKSMLVGALGLVLGGRANAGIVRTGAKEAEVQALFTIEPGSRIATRLEAAGVPCDGELIIRRVVQAEGRSRGYLNGRMVTQTELADLGSELCDIASQHESVTLTDPATHVDYLDAFGRLTDDREKLAAEVDELSRIAKELDQKREADRTRAERGDFLSFVLKEIDDLDPKPGEERELEQERARLRHAARLTDATRRAADRLYDGENAICDELGRLAGELSQAAEIDSSLADYARTLDTARGDLSDLARALGRYADGVEVNPDRQSEVEERLFGLQKLLRKHGPSTEELLAHREAVAKELSELSRSGEDIAKLEAEKEKRLAIAATTARALSQARKDAAEKLADAIGRELGALGMGRARVVVDISAHAPSSDSLTIEGSKLTRTGIDRVEFLIAPNRGEAPRPLRKIASGGELSRALLALKRVLADQGPAGLYVFDEVDAGVGGAIAEVIGRAIANIAKHRQVLCITHLAQIAALADLQFVVGKTETKGRTLTSVQRLDESDRVEEIARMMGGLKVGTATRDAAAEMLAARAKKEKPPSARATRPG